MTQIEDIHTPSEFFPGGYDIAAISEAFDAAIIFVYKRTFGADELYDKDVYKEVVSRFNIEFSSRSDYSSFDAKKWKDGSDKLEELIEFDELLWDEEQEKKKGKTKDKAEYVKTLFENYNSILANYKETQRLYEPELAEKYLDSFFNLSKNVVFYPDSFNLTSTKFRKSRFLNALLSFAIKEIPCKVKPDPKAEADNKTGDYSAAFSCYEVSFFDPFAYDIISRALETAARLIIDAWRENNEYLFDLRRSMFVCSIESAFQRVFTIEGQSYLVELNRHTSKLMAYPIDMMSSISDTKTIRLFEKTAAYIRNNIYQNTKDNNGIAEYSIQVTILGHSELSLGGLESSMRDYLSEVLHWYDSLEISTKPKLNLRVVNYYNQSDKPDILVGDAYDLPEKRKKATANVQEHYAECVFERADYELEYTYSLKNIRKQIVDSDLMFILDCPWLSTENYSIEKERSINDYCIRLNGLERNKILADKSLLLDSSRFYRSSPMSELSDQYNRIMSSTSLNAGSVVRSMRDDMIRKIQKYINENSFENKSVKELYIFSSENEGVNYSYINSYPLTRLEQYDGKHFTIIQFTNRKLPMLPYRSEASDHPHFEIDVWSVLKYLCFSYAYKYPVDILLNNNDYVLKSINNDSWYNEPIELLELIQNIVIVFDLCNSLKEITISLGFTELFDNLVKEHNTISFNHYSDREQEEYIGSIKESLGRQVLKLIKPLYRDAVFKKNRHYGDDAIKLGFKMTLYSAANDVNTMLFYHLYEEACNKDDFSCFKLSFESENKYKRVGRRDFKNASFFADKKLYCTLFNSFESDYQLYMGMVKMLEDAKELYGKNDSSRDPEEILLENMALACRQSGTEDSILFTNLLRTQFYILRKKERQRQNGTN